MPRRSLMARIRRWVDRLAIRHWPDPDATLDWLEHRRTVLPPRKETDDRP